MEDTKERKKGKKRMEKKRLVVMVVEVKVKVGLVLLRVTLAEVLLVHDLLVFLEDLHDVKEILVFGLDELEALDGSLRLKKKEKKSDQSIK